MARNEFTPDRLIYPRGVAEQHVRAFASAFAAVPNVVF
jgi:hypothetical protein